MICFCWGLHCTGYASEGGSRLAGLSSVSLLLPSFFRWRDDFELCSVSGRRIESESLLWSFMTVTLSALKQLRRKSWNLDCLVELGIQYWKFRLQVTTERTFSIRDSLCFSCGEAKSVSKTVLYSSSFMASSAWCCVPFCCKYFSASVSSPNIQACGRSCGSYQATLWCWILWTMLNVLCQLVFVKQKASM